MLRHAGYAAAASDSRIATTTIDTTSNGCTRTGMEVMKSTSAPPEPAAPVKAVRSRPMAGMLAHTSNPSAVPATVPITPTPAAAMKKARIA